MGQVKPELAEIDRQIRSCRACSLSRTADEHLCGEGDPGARLFFIAQAPGYEENREGRMFIGPSGLLFRELIDSAGLDMKDLYLTNLIKCMLPHYRRPKRIEIETCSRFLEQEIRICSPEILIPLGYYAAAYLFSRSAEQALSRTEYPERIGRLHRIGGQKILPLSHPALALHQPEMKEHLFTSWQILSVVRQPCIWSWVCPIRDYTQRGLIDDHWYDLYCLGDWSSCRRYEAEQLGIPHPDRMMPDGSIDGSLPG